MAALTMLIFTPAVAGIPPVATESEVKAAFLSNFVNFVEWPPTAMAGGGPIQMCVVGSPSVSDSLRIAVRGRMAWGRDIAVTTPAFDASFRACHLLYITDVDAKATRQLVQSLTGATVFTVSDFNRFAALGGVANFFVQAGRLRFAVNMEAALRARLQISSKMLMLATFVKEEL